MGCTKSKPQGAGGNGSKAQGGSGRNQSQDMRLLEEYSVGQPLGEGAFGVVSTCKKRSTGEEFAVKMVDKVETPVEAIKKEADILQSMDHPNIVKFHGVYYERCFVCIVMDKYTGGDMVEGLQRHLKERGQIPCGQIIHVARQMGASIEHLHGRLVVHCDIKGDNYVMDRKDMTNPECRIVLTDFGDAVKIGTSEERLKTAKGTKIYWSPERYDKNYGAKVDVWGMGVVMYGLVSGRFPFRDENDIRTKDPKIPKRASACEGFIKSMLDKEEASRPASSAVLEHEWLSSAGRNSQNNDDPDDEGDATTTNVEKDAANEGIQARRQELINRLNKEREKRSKTNVPAAGKKERNFMMDGFSLMDKQGGQMVYEWWGEKKVKEKLLDKEGQSTPAKVDGAIDLMLHQMLQEHNIDPESQQQLTGEVRSGAARLMLDATAHKKLVHVVDVVLLRVRSPDQQNSRLLVEVTRKTGCLPGTEKEPHENTRQTAERTISDLMGLDNSCFVFDLTNIDRHEEEKVSASYPGLRTVYRKEIVEARLSSTDPVFMANVGLPGFKQWEAKDKDGNRKLFAWMSDKEAEAKKVKLKSEGTEAVSTLVRASIGLGEEALREYLRSQRIDVDRFDPKTLKEFSSELIKGEAALMQVAGVLSRVVDIVVLIITKSSGEVLVQTEQILKDGHKQQLNLPDAKRRPDENHFVSARRILRQLEIDANQVELDTNVTNIEEEKSVHAYPGMQTIYLKRLIKARMLDKVG